MADPGTIPFLMPGRRRLRADAVWITACNWAGAVDVMGGTGLITTGDGRWTTADAVMRSLYEPKDPLLPPKEPLGGRRLRSMMVMRELEALLGDKSWARSGREWRTPSLPGDAVAGEFVWQHHDLFHTAGRALADRLGRPLVQFVDAPIVWEARQWGLRRVGRGARLQRTGELPQLRDADLVACVSSAVADAVSDEFGIDDPRLLVTPCTVDVRRFEDPHDRVRNEVRGDLGMSADEVAVAWVGSFRKFHAVDLLIESFARLRLQHPATRLFLIGDGATRGRVELLARELGLGSDVVFVGQRPPPEVARLLLAMDIGVLPAASGEFHYSPLKLREYAAAGLAIVASDVGQVGDSLTDGAGLVVPPGSSDALVSALAELCRDGERRRALGAGACGLAADEFDITSSIELVRERLATFGPTPQSSG